MSLYTLVLLPGMDGSGEMFAPLLAELGDVPLCTLQVCAYPKQTPQTYAQLQAWITLNFPATGHLILLAESFAGPLAIALAAALPERVRGLILCVTFARNPRPLFTPWQAATAWLPFDILPTVGASKLLFGRFETVFLRKMLARSLAQVNASVLQMRLREVLAVDVSSQLQQITTPILYLRAKHDLLVPAAASLSMRQSAPQMQIVELDAPHGLLQVQAKQAAALVRGFLLALPKIDANDA